MVISHTVLDNNASYGFLYVYHSIFNSVAVKQFHYMNSKVNNHINQQNQCFLGSHSYEHRSSKKYEVHFSVHHVGCFES